MHFQSFSTLSITILALLPAPLASAQPSNWQHAADLSKRANDLYVQSRYSEAEPLFRRALDAWTALGSQAVPERATAMRDLGSVLRMLGRYAESETLLKQSLPELVLPHEKVRALWSLAALYRTRGDYAAAENSARHALEIAEDGDVNGSKLVLSSIYVEEHLYGEATPLLLELERTSTAGALVAVYDDLAAIKLASQDYAAAANYSRKAIDAAQKSVGPNHSAVAAAWNNLGQALRFEGNFEEAEQSYHQSLDAWERGVGPSHPNSAKVMMNLAGLHHERGREHLAEELYTRAASILEKAYGPHYPAALVARNELADVLRAEHRYSESNKIGQDTLKELEKTFAPDDSRVTNALLNRARLLRETGHSREADQLLSRVPANAHVSGTILPR